MTVVVKITNKIMTRGKKTNHVIFIFSNFFFMKGKKRKSDENQFGIKNKK